MSIVFDLKHEHYGEDEKCGIIYKTNSSFNYQCAICSVVLDDIDTFKNHIVENQCFSNNGKSNKFTNIEVNQNEDGKSINSYISNNQSYDLEMKHRLNKQTTDSKSNFYKGTEDKSESKVTKKRIVKRIKWQLDKVFSTELAAQNYILSQKIWSFLHKNYTKKGMKKYYRCNQVKFRGQQCASSILYFANINSATYEVYRSSSEHTCGSIGNLLSNSQISKEHKIRINELHQKGTKVKDIIKTAEQEYNLKSNQVKNYLKLLKIRKENSIRNEIKDWIKANDKLPKDDHVPFVVSVRNDETSLKYFTSTKSMLSNALNVQSINLNGVKKLIWHTFSIYFPGVVDELGNFKCFGVAVCQSDKQDDFSFIFETLIEALDKFFNSSFSPKTLCRDSNLNVEIAFQKNFSKKTTIKLCWSHVRNKLKTKLEYLLPEHHNKKEYILKELDIIQRSTTYEEFQESIEIFSKKWALYVEFVTYFHQDWVEKNFNWFRADQETLSTNCSIDLLVKKIQNDENFRERLPFSLFKAKLVEWIQLLLQPFNNSVSQHAIFESKSARKSESDSLLSETISLNVNVNPPEANEKLTFLKKRIPRTSYKTSVNSKSLSPKISRHEKRKRSEKLWKEDVTFENLAKAEIAIEAEKIWSLSTKNRTKAGTKIYFRCNRVPFRGRQCDSCVYLFLKSDSTEVILVRSGLPHNCHNIAFKSRGIDKEIRIEIARLNDLNWKPTQIFDYIKEQNFKNFPTKTQISNYLAVLREKKCLAIKLHLEGFSDWLIRHCRPPENETQMFVLSHECINNEYQFLVSSKKLLQNAKNIKLIHADEIHKLEWINFSVYFIGITDVQSNFSCLGIAICHKTKQQSFEFIFKSLKDEIYRIFDYHITPSILITDTNHNIQTAFKTVFKQGKIQICRDLMRKRVKDKLHGLALSKETISEIQKGIENVSSSSTEEEFNQKCNIFVTKWSKQKEFYSFFCENFIGKDEKPFQFFKNPYLMTNLKLETYVKLFKNDELFRKKIPLESLSTILERCIRKWSLECYNFIS